MSVKLPFDQNLSPKLVKRLENIYPNSDHLDLLGLGTADDVLVWEHARQMILLSSRKMQILQI